VSAFACVTLGQSHKNGNRANSRARTRTTWETASGVKFQGMCVHTHQVGLKVQTMGQPAGRRERLVIGIIGGACDQCLWYRADPVESDIAASCSKTELCRSRLLRPLRPQALNSLGRRTSALAFGCDRRNLNRLRPAILCSSQHRGHYASKFKQRRRIALASFWQNEPNPLPPKTCRLRHKSKFRRW
jgi:hypothetical protein